VTNTDDGQHDWRSSSPLCTEFPVLENLRLTVGASYGAFLSTSDAHVGIEGAIAVYKANAAFQVAVLSYRNTARILSGLVD